MLQFWWWAPVAIEVPRGNGWGLHDCGSVRRLLRLASLCSVGSTSLQLERQQMFFCRRSTLSLSLLNCVVVRCWLQKCQLVRKSATQIPFARHGARYEF